MADLSIPKPDHEGLIRLVTLTEQQFGELVAALRDSPPKFFREDLEREVAERVNRFSSDDLRPIIGAVWSCAIARSSYDLPLDEFIESIRTSANSEGLVKTSDEVATLTGRLHSLLELQTLGLPPKARALLSEGHVYCRARVISEVMPIFSTDDAVEAPSTAMIVHNLSLHYHDAGRLRSMTVQLDSGDLENLYEILQRALAKHEKLLALLKTSGVKHLDM